MPHVSIITPTVDRGVLLPALWNCVRAQSMQDFEWLVHDGSVQPAPIFETIMDERIRYMHVPTPMSIGARRNALCDAAKGKIIVQFDDDDHYAPAYVERMLSFMTDAGASFVKLFGFFLYHRLTDTFAYWDLKHDFPSHYVLVPHVAQLRLRAYRGRPDARWGFGFSYVFARRVWEAIHFPDRNHGEDQEFANAAVARFKSAGMQDTEHLCVHVIHVTNSSNSFPQQILPAELLEEAFPHFKP